MRFKNIVTLALSTALFACVSVGIPAPVAAVGMAEAGLDSFQPMPREMLGDLQTLMKTDSATGFDVTDGQYSTLFSFTGLKLDSPQDLQRAGALYKALGTDFSARLSAAISRNDAATKKTLYQEALKHYSQAAREVKQAMQAEITNFRSTLEGKNPKEAYHAAYDEAHRLERWSVYGPDVAGEIRATRNLAAKAEKAFSDDEARKLGASPTPDEFVPGHDGSPRPSGLARYSLPVQTVVETRLAQALEKTGLTMRTLGDTGAGTAAETEEGVEQFVNGQRALMGLAPSYDYKFGSDMFTRKFGPGRGGKLFILRRADGSVAGTAAFVRYPYPESYDNPAHRACEMEMVFLDETLRGSGLGKKMMLMLMAQASRAGYEVMELGTRKVSMAVALANYLKLGWVPSADTHWTTRGVNAEGIPDFFKHEEYGYFARDIRPQVLAADFPMEFADWRTLIRTGPR